MLAFHVLDHSLVQLAPGRGKEGIRIRDAGMPILRLAIGMPIWQHDPGKWQFACQATQRLGRAIGMPNWQFNLASQFTCQIRHAISSQDEFFRIMSLSLPVILLLVVHVADHAKGYDAGRPEGGLGQSGHGLRQFRKICFYFPEKNLRKSVAHLRAPNFGKQFENEFLKELTIFCKKFKSEETGLIYTCIELEYHS